MRILSLLPAATEIVCALGARDNLVGISHECDYPPEIDGLPVVSRPRAWNKASASTGDAFRDAVSIFEVDEERFAELRPDVVVTQDLCEVCAVTPDDVRRATGQIAGTDVRIVSLSAVHLGGIWDDIRRVGQAIAREAEAERLIGSLTERLETLSARSAAAHWRPKAISIEWLDPVIPGGLWTEEITLAAGGVPLGPRTGQKGTPVTADALLAFDPDIVIVKPCGFNVARTLLELDRLQSAIPWETWRACQSGLVFVVDGSAYFNRPGPRIADSAEILAACFNPPRFPDHLAAYAGAIRRIGPDGEVFTPDPAYEPPFGGGSHVG